MEELEVSSEKLQLFRSAPVVPPSRLLLASFCDSVMHPSCLIHQRPLRLLSPRQNERPRSHLQEPLVDSKVVPEVGVEPTRAFQLNGF